MRQTRPIRLEIKSISITRLKLQTALYRQYHRHLGLKSKASRLRDWNIIILSMSDSVVYDLKSKASRLRDWNCNRHGLNSRQVTLEIKSISITRLKLMNSAGFTALHTFLKSKASRLRDWNSGLPVTSIVPTVPLEIKSISITRLKLLYRTWLQSHFLSLEIKSISITRLKREHGYLRLPEDTLTWNQKHLDYEIETCISTLYRSISA